MISSDSRRSMSILAGFALMKVLGVTVILVLLGVPPLVGLLVGLVAAAIGVWLLATKSQAVVLRASRAEPTTQADQPRLHNVVEGLCVSTGIDKPDLYVIDDAALNTLVCARTPKDVSLVVTTGLLAATDRVQLEGVLAHQLCRIKDGDVAADTLVTTTAGSVTLAADLCLRAKRWNGGRLGRDDREGGDRPALGSVGSGLFALAGLWAWMLHRALGPDRSTERDVAAVTSTRFPPGLLGALAEMETSGTVSHAGLRSTSHLWLASPVALTPDAGEYSELNRRFDRHPPLSSRIETLREL